MVPDVTLRVTILMWLINKWDSSTINVETSFLYALLKVEIYIKIPEGMLEVLEEYSMYEDILIIIKSIYGILQAARFWFKE